MGSAGELTVQSQSRDNSSPVLEAQELCSFQIRILADMDDNMLTAHSSSTSDAPVDGSMKAGGKQGEKLSKQDAL